MTDRELLEQIAKDLGDRLTRIEERLDSLTEHVTDSLMMRHEVTNLRDRVILLERHRDSTAPPSNGIGGQ